MSAYTARDTCFLLPRVRTHARMHTRTYVRKYTVQPRSIRFVKRRHSLPFSIPRTDNIVRASRRIPGSAFLAPHDLVLSPSRLPSSSVSVYLAERVSSVILSGCITYRAIECPDRDPGTRAPIQSGRSIILSPRNAPPLGNLIGWLKQRARNPAMKGEVEEKREEEKREQRRKEKEGEKVEGVVRATDFYGMSHIRSLRDPAASRVSRAKREDVG